MAHSQKRRHSLWRLTILARKKLEKLAGTNFWHVFQDNLFKDAMEYAAESKNAEVAEDLLAYFLEHR